MADTSVTQPKQLGVFSPYRTVDLGATKIVYLSGLTSAGKAPDDTKAQTQIIFDRMAELLAIEGGGLEHLVKITAFLTDVRDYGVYNEVRNAIFASQALPPASATIGGAELVRPEARVEIEGVAVIPKTGA